MRLPALRGSALFLALSLALVATDARANCSSHPADVSPGSEGSEMPTPNWTVIGNGQVDVSDVLVLLNAVVGKYVIVWAPPVEPTCVAVPGNLSPGSQDDGFSPPRWTPTPDGVLDIGDVLVALRFVVGLIELDPDWLAPIVADGTVGDRVVAGSVIDSVNAAGLAEVIVTALLDEEEVGETETDSAGKFLLQGLPSGILKLRLDGSAIGGGGKFSSLTVEVNVDTTETTSVPPITLADGEAAGGDGGKFNPDETGTLDEAVELSGDDGDVGLETGSGGKITVNDEVPEGDVDLSVSPVSGEDLPEGVTDPDTGDPQNTTGEVAVNPTGGKFTGGGAGAGLSASGVEPGFDLILPNDDDLPIGTMVDIWHWNGASWTNCTAETGRGGIVIDLMDGMGGTAVRADGVATQGGLYAAAQPIDFFCVSALSGRVLDQLGMPLAGVFVTTSLGSSGFTDELGNFFIENIPAYRDLLCTTVGYEVFVRGGLALGNATASTTVEDFDITVGLDTYVGDLTLTVPDEGCLSGLIRQNGSPVSGTVTVIGPSPSTATIMLTAGAQGRFADPDLAPGSYRARFRFPGEMVDREFDFAILPRACTTVRLEVNQGSGSSRLTVEVVYDDDDDFLTENGPESGVAISVTDGSSTTFTALTGNDGKVTFDGLVPPYDIVGIMERPVPQQMESGRTAAEGSGRMRIGSGIQTSAPSGFVSLFMRLPLQLDAPEAPYEGDVTGNVTNLPASGPNEFFGAASLRRGTFDGLFGGFVDEFFGTYYSQGFFQDFDVALTRTNVDPPFNVLEAVFHGPFQLPPPVEGGAGAEVPVLMQDLDWNGGVRLLFDQTVNLNHLDFGATAGEKSVGILGRHPNGRRFFSVDNFLPAGAPLPTTAQLPNPGGTGFEFVLEVGSEASDGESLPEQFTLVPLSFPYPDPIQVPFSFISEITSPRFPELEIDQVRLGNFTYASSNNVSPFGFDLLTFESQAPGPVGPGEIAITSFMRILPASNSAAGAIGPTPQAFGFPGWSGATLLDSVRSDAFPTTFQDMFGDGLNERFLALGMNPHVLTFNSHPIFYDIIENQP